MCVNALQPEVLASRELTYPVVFSKGSEETRFNLQQTPVDSSELLTTSSLSRIYSTKFVKLEQEWRIGDRTHDSSKGLPEQFSK